MAGLLAAAGVCPGDRVALLGENGPSWGIAYFAVPSMGAVVVPILTDFPAGQIGTIVAHAGCRAVLVSARLREKLAAALESSRESRPAVIDLEEATSSAATALDLPTVRADDLAAIIYTSGTTGHSKGVTLTHGNIVSNAVATRTILAIHPGDRLLSILPLAHAYECTLGFVGALLQGASITYLDRPSHGDRAPARAGQRTADDHAHRAARDREDRARQGAAPSWRSTRGTPARPYVPC